MDRTKFYVNALRACRQETTKYQEQVHDLVKENADLKRENEQLKLQSKRIMSLVQNLPTELML